MPDTFISFALFTIIATLSPGGATTLATASGVRFGYRRSMPLMLGIAAGLAILASAGATGLGALLNAAPTLQVAIKLVGTVYLLWLAMQIWNAGRPQTPGETSPSPHGFLAGVALLLLNPKGWAMTMAAAGSFAALSAKPLTLAAIMAATFATAAVASLSLWCLGGTLLAQTLNTEAQWRLVNRVLGALLAASIVPLWMP
ncbi:MAG: LysE family translocator [Pseudomonadota bacterium]